MIRENGTRAPLAILWDCALAILNPSTLVVTGAGISVAFGAQHCIPHRMSPGATGCLSRLAWPSFNFGWGQSWLSTFLLVQNANGWNDLPPAAICTRTVRCTDRALDRSMIEVKTMGRFQRLTPPAKMTQEERTLLWNRSVQEQLP